MNYLYYINILKRDYLSEFPGFFISAPIMFCLLFMAPVILSANSDDCVMPGDSCHAAMKVFDLVTNPNYDSIFPQCVELCLEMANPDNTAPVGCDFSQSPTVWIMLETDDIPSQLITSVAPAGSWDPLWTVYYGDCDNLTPIANSLGTDCNFDVATTPIQSDSNRTITTYYIAITADPNGPPIDDSNFTFCAYARVEVLTCIGPDYGCQENDPSTEIEVLWREFQGPLEGPFCPGEEVRIKIHFFYDASESQVDWFHGFIPDFGPGWDLLNFDWEASLPTATGPNGGAASFHQEGTECEAQLHRSFPHLCTYRDELGILRLVHTECDEDITKCTGFGMGDEDVLPNGFFWLSDGASASCVSGSCRPRQRWGIGGKSSTVDWEFNIKVREFESAEEYLQNRDLKIGFLPFSDYGAGCWDDDSPCRLDKKQYGPKWMIEYSVPVQPKEICAGSEVGLNVSASYSSGTLIEITYEENPNVTGMNNHTFINVSGVIDDILTIVDPDACDPEVVIYYIKTIMPGIIYQDRIDTFEVVVYPVPVIFEQDTQNTKMAELPIYLPIEGNCETQDYTYSWFNLTNNRSGSSNIIDVQRRDGVGTHIYSLSVSNAIGCMSSTELQVNVLSDVRFRIEGDTLCWGETKTFNVEIPAGADPNDYIYEWYWENGDTIASNDFVYAIASDQYGVDYFPDEESLCLRLLIEYDDGIYLQSDTCVKVWFRNPFKTLVEPNPAYICQSPDTVSVSLIFDEVNGLSYSDIYDICWHGQNGTNCSPQLFTQDFSLSWYQEQVHVRDIYGCDTIMFFNVLENDLHDLNVEIEGNTLIAKVTDAKYQWLDCNAGMEPVEGETEQSFTPVISGSYAVRIEKNSCVDTSLCHTIILTGIDDMSFGRKFYIYPNPGENRVVIDLMETYSQVMINVFTAEGREVFSRQYGNVSSIKLDTEWASGLYHVVITSGEKSAVLPFVRK